ncbi:MAG: acyl-CoA dehydratase activase-related protein [candidate division WOR-3 bacterium]|nr:acyl-CoA dehydratase activase-related protein [candidate division WOR-3 bacterium]
MTIGIPRALFYYRYGKFWEQLFQSLGIKIVVSPKTNKQILEKGLVKVSSEVCLPIKIVCGHIEILKNQVDAVFLPRFIRLNQGLYACPKMIGIVDIVRMQVGKSCQILSPTIKDNFIISHFLTGLTLTKNPFQTKQALKSALPYLKHNQPKTENSQLCKSQILLLSHFYNTGDEFIVKDILSTFESYGFAIVTKEDLPENILSASRGFAQNIRWVYERELYNAFKFYLDKVAGICNIISFGCGPDSLICEIMSSEAQIKNVPFLKLVIDEHTSKTGLITRIEAFSEIVIQKLKTNNKLLSAN